MKKVLFLFALLLVCPILVLAEQIDINSATLSQLDEIVGIGATYAQRIIDGRPYSSIDDLDRVKGIGPATIQKIKDQGFACVNCQTEITQIIKPDDQKIITAVQTATYPTGIFINEIMPNPEGADETEEWIELYNSNNFDVDLSGWQIQDRAGTITTYTINPSTGSGQAKILANSFIVFKRPETNIMLNNDNDGINLLTPDKKVEDFMVFASAPLGQSYNKTSTNLKWSTTPTPGALNIITTVAPFIKALSNTKNSVNNNVKEAGLADISQAIDINQEINPSTGSGQASPWFLFFTALAGTIILALIILFIKLKLNNHVRT